MLYASFLLLLGLRAWSALASNSPLDTLTVQAPDGSIKANFIAAGAHITNLYVKDKRGTFRDVILGYDDRSQYLSDVAHPYFGAVVGRYANRIKNGTFDLPTGETVHIEENENMGRDTLHGGFFGYDLRIWSVASQNANSVSFSLYDPAGDQGFPGSVNASVTYTLENDSKWKIDMKATPSALTPIMLSQHTYWNLEAYQESQDLSAHHIQVAADRYIKIDGIEIPTGEIGSVAGTPLDLRDGAVLADIIPELGGYCGTGCTGLDNALIYDNETAASTTAKKVSLWSDNSGIRLDITSNQVSAQVYSCNGIQTVRNITRKADQGSGFYTDHSCVVLEQQSWIDAINNPQWGINQFYDAGEQYTWDALYSFSVIKD